MVSLDHDRYHEEVQSIQKDLMIAKKHIVVLIIIVVLITGLWIWSKTYLTLNFRHQKVISFLRAPENYRDTIVPALSQCRTAPFVMPTSGMIGFIWGDSFRPGHRHQGIDIFGGSEVGKTPVFAAYDGYLTRQDSWLSTLVIRIPQDPMDKDQQIWIYYTHMADASGNSLIVDCFLPGKTEIFVKAGTLLGYQGNYSGTPGSPTGIHLHFSIIKDDGEGMHLNELKFRNTIDPSPYFGMELNARRNLDEIPMCGQSK